MKQLNPGRRYLGGFLGTALAVSVCTGSAFGTHRAYSASASTATVTIDASSSLASVPSTAIGLNTAVWDGHLQDSPVPGLLQRAGVQVLRFPGGSTSDVYHWQTNSITPGQGGYANPANTFDAFMHNVVLPSGAQPVITVNYGSNSTGNSGGDPNEAASWVNYANNVQHYGVKYWEIGNEVYGNGYYGSSWETDLHSDHSPVAYAQNALSFIRAMKAADPSVKVGLVLTAPGNWPDGQGPEDWNSTVLSIAGQAADFVSVHWYAQSPGSESDSGLLASTSSIPNMVAHLRSLIATYCGSHASKMGIMVTESNSVSYNPGKQTTTPINGLFLIKDYLTWLQEGVQNVTWWDLHNGESDGNNTSSSLAGTTGYGDYGVLASGGGQEPAANTPFPSYTALALLQPALIPGSIFLTAASSTPDIQAYALRHQNGQIALILVNSSATNAYVVSPSLQNAGTITSASGTSFSLASPQLTALYPTVQNGRVSFTAGPYSATLLQLDTQTGTGASPTPTPTLTSTSTPTPTLTSTSTPTTTPTSTPTSFAGSGLTIADFEGSVNGFTGNPDVTAMGPSSWSPTVASGNSSLWVDYTIPNAYSEAQISKVASLYLGAYKTLSVSVFAKQPTVTGTGVKVRFLVRGSNGIFYASSYQSVPIGTRTTVQWNMSAVPRTPIRALYVCWQFTTAITGTGSEIWFDNIHAQ